MNVKRGIGIGLVLYIVTFIIGIILTLLAPAILQSPQDTPTVYWIITLVITVLMTGLVSLWYFKGKNTRRNWKEGLKLGITFVVLGFILDLLFFIPTILTSSGARLLLEYYSEPAFYFTILLVIATAVFIGSRGQHSEKNNPLTKKSKHL